MNTADKISIMQAFVDGKRIQYRDSTNTWCPASTPRWDWNLKEYRIKPEPKVIYVNEYYVNEDNYEYMIGFTLKENATKHGNSSCKRTGVKYIEVIE